MESNQPRITGIETEYGLSYETSEKFRSMYSRLPYDDGIEVLPFERLPREVDRSSGLGMLSNGARYYMDIGTHPEYSTPEAATFREVVAHDLAGERIVFQSFEKMREEGLLEEFRLNKRVVDMQELYWGRHENYLVSRGLDPDTQIIPQMALHLATRSIWAGAGMVRKGGEFTMAQKMNAIYTLNEHAAHTRGNRPLVDIGRDEALADSLKWRRLHVASVDANMFPWNTWMALGTTSLVLRMVEQGDELSDLQLSAPVQAARSVIYDLSFQKRLSQKTSAVAMTALDIQEALAERAGKLAQAGVLPPEEVEVAEEWIKLCQDLRMNPEECITRVEWMAKGRFLGGIALRKNISMKHPHIRKFDVLWDDLDEERGYAQKLRAKNGLPSVVSEEEISTAMTEPPQGRARLRGRLIKEAARQCRLYGHAVEERISWDQFHITRRRDGVTKIFRVVMDDPYQDESTEVDRILGQMTEQ